MPYHISTTLVDQRLLRAIRQKERKLVERIKAQNPGEEIEYVQNLNPKTKAEYILVTMEPSLGGWINWSRPAKSGLRNFMLSWEDFILHYCAKHFLGGPYYITDIAKAAMKVRTAGRLRNYDEWISLLREEINVVGRPDYKLVFVGKTVERAISCTFAPEHIAGTTIHYSPMVAYMRKNLPRNPPSAVMAVTEGSILKFARALLAEHTISEATKTRVLKRLGRSGTKLSDSRRRLMYTYYEHFESFGQSP
jgi:hypothetical protein